MATATRKVLDMLLQGTIDADQAEELLGAIVEPGASARANVQRLAGDIGIAYNTARARLDEIVQAIGGSVSTRMRLPILPQLRASTRCWTALHRAGSTPQGRSTNCGAGAAEVTRARHREH